MVTAAAATKVVFGQQPNNCIAGVPMTPSVTVDVEDQFGNIVTTANSSMTLATESGPGFLLGTSTVTAVNGVATFSNLLFDAATISSYYTLLATDGALTSAVSNTFTVSPAAPEQLAFIQQPANAFIGVPISPAISVSVEDQFGNIVTSANPSVTLFTDSGPANPQGTTTVTAVNGVATFGNVYFLAGGTYVLFATSVINSNWLYSVSNQFIEQDTTTTAVNSSTSGQSVTFTATVVPANAGIGETGSVQFQIDGVNAGLPVTLSGNTATYTTATLGNGVHSVVAVYSGDEYFAGSTSSPYPTWSTRRWLHLGRRHFYP